METTATPLADAGNISRVSRGSIFHKESGTLTCHWRLLAGTEYSSSKSNRRVSGRKM